MNDADRKFLTEAMKEHWHEPIPIPGIDNIWELAYCSCGIKYTFTLDGCKHHQKESNRTFSTPQDFFDLWNWAKGQEWWNYFWEEWMIYEDKDANNTAWYNAGVIEPVRFPELILQWLREKENDR